MSHAYPLLLDVTDRLVVIIGGGAVAVRKVAGLLAAGATRVRVVAPMFHADMPQNIERRVGNYQSSDLDGADLVFAATDSPEVNAAVVKDARARKIWVNRADADEESTSDFANVAMFRDGVVIVSVSTGGSPAIAAHIRDQIQHQLDPKWIALANAMQSLRPMIMAANLPMNARRELFKSLASDESADLLAREGLPGLIAWIENRMK